MSTDEILFKEALREKDLTKMRKVLKGDVHNHCGLGMRFTTFNKWAGGIVSEPPRKIDGITGLDNYIINETAKYISNEEDMAFLIEETVKEAIEDGVKILEASLDCHNMRFFSTKDRYFATIERIKEKYKDSIDFRPEVGMAKSITALDLDEFLLPCLDSGVFKSIDLYGDEKFDDYSRIKEYYKYARERGLKLKAHAGEFHGPDNIIKVIDLLDVDEIQHGIGAVSNKYLMDLIKERKIRLNICPSSNYILGAVDDMAKHPIRHLFDNEIPITINTDDLLLFNSGVSEEYLFLYKIGLFNEDELNIIRKNSLL